MVDDDTADEFEARLLSLEPAKCDVSASENWGVNDIQRFPFSSGLTVTVRHELD